MKITKGLFMFAAAGLMFVGCKEAAKSPEIAAETEIASVDAPEGKIETATFEIEGMNCAVSCANTIEKKLAKADGVKNASVDYESKTAKVEFDSSKQSPEKLAELVEAVADGKTYKVANMKSSGDQAMMVFGDKEKEKKKKKKKNAKADEASSDKKAGCSSEAAAGKPGCCAAKKAAAASEEKGTL